MLIELLVPVAVSITCWYLETDGSVDRTVKFWDLETFELIGSARREATGVHSIAIHPDGRTLFTGHEDGLKLIKPYGDGSSLAAKTSEGMEHKLNLKENKQEQVEVDVGPTTRFRSVSPDESKEIKNIYIDCSTKIEGIPEKTDSKDDNLVFVAGATGRVGSRTVRELIKHGFKVRAGVRSAERAGPLIKSVEQMKLDDGTSGGKSTEVQTHNLTLSTEDTLFGGQVSNLQVAELMAVMAKNPDLAYCKIVEVVAETTAPLTPREELLAKISSQRPYISSPKKPDATAISDPAPSELAIATATEKETAQPKPVAKESLSPFSNCIKRYKATPHYSS
ncbi:Protein TIC 62 [Arachis hypogaea]|nr:Protein TIC 62 [Arachis hypogaea]